MAFYSNFVPIRRRAMKDVSLHEDCSYTDVGNFALRTSSMADTLTGSCLFVPISSSLQQFLAWIFGSFWQF